MSPRSDEYMRMARSRLASAEHSLDGGLTEEAEADDTTPGDVHIAMCTLSCMRTNIEIDDDVMRAAQEVTGIKTKRETVDLALREMVARQRRIGVLDLRGRVHWEGDLDQSRRGRA